MRPGDAGVRRSRCRAVPPAGGRRATPRPDYARRRLVAGVLVLTALVLLAVAATGLLAGLGGEPASASGALPVTSPRTLIAQPGDTLWEIAAEHRGDVDLRRYLEALIDVNGGAPIRAGQTVRLP